MPIFFQALLVDVVIIAIVALFIWLQAMRGFVRTLIELVGCILAIVISFSAAGYFSDVIYDNAIEPKIVASVNDSLEKNTDDSINTAVDNVWDSIPAFVTAFTDKNGVSKDKLKSTITSSVENGTDGAGEIISNNIVKPVTTSAMAFVMAAILFLLLMILVRFLANKINMVFELPVLKTFNATLGGVLGFIKGGILIFAIVMLISLLMPLFSDKLWIFTPELIDNTHLFRLLYNLSPFISL